MFFEAVMQYEFLQNALFGALLSSLVCGIIGPFVVVQRIGYMAGGISHAVLGGMGAAYFFGYSPLIGALVAAVVAALIIGWVGLVSRQTEETVIGALWAAGMAVGVIFIANTPGSTADLMSYLFGNILMISDQDLYFMGLLAVVVAVVVLLFYKQLVANAFDPDFARLRGLPINFYHILVLLLVALTVVILVQVVGLILVIALLSVPAAIARQFVYSFPKMMIVAIINGAVFSLVGTAVSYQLNWPAGATIILVVTMAYLVALSARNLYNSV